MFPVQNLIPETLSKYSSTEFLKQLNVLDEEFQTIKDNQKPDHVLRYVGDLSGDLSQDKGNLEVKLVSVPGIVL